MMLDIAISLHTSTGNQIILTPDEARTIWQELDKLFGPNRMRVELIPPSLPTYKLPPVTS